MRRSTLSHISRRLAVATLVCASVTLPMMAKAQNLQEITYLLPAPGTLPAFGPWMIAQAKGYYKAEGLDVKFVAARGGVDVAKQVGAGNAVIGGAIGDTPIIARAQGIPVKAVAVLGAGSLTHLTAELFKAQTNTFMVHIPYRGIAPATTDLIAGQTQAMFPGLAAALPHIRNGRLRAIAVTGTQRHPARTPRSQSPADRLPRRSSPGRSPPSSSAFGPTVSSVRDTTHLGLALKARAMP